MSRFLNIKDDIKLSAKTVCAVLLSSCDNVKKGDVAESCQVAERLHLGANLPSYSSALVESDSSDGMLDTEKEPQGDNCSDNSFVKNFHLVLSSDSESIVCDDQPALLGADDNDNTDMNSDLHSEADAIAISRDNIADNEISDVEDDTCIMNHEDMDLIEDNVENIDRQLPATISSFRAADDLDIKTADDLVNELGEDLVTDYAEYRVNTPVDDFLNTTVDDLMNEAGDHLVNETAGSLVINADDNIANEVANDLDNDDANNLLNEAADDFVSKAANDLVNKAADDRLNKTVDDFLNETVDDLINESGVHLVNETAGINESGVHLVINADDDIANEVAKDLDNDTANNLLIEAADDFVSKADDDLVNKAADDLVSKTVDDFLNEAVDDLMNKSGDHLINETAGNIVINADDDIANEVANDLDNDAANDLLNEAANDFVSKAADDLVNKAAANNLLNEAANDFVNKVADDCVNKAVDDFLNETVGDLMNEAGDHLVNKTAGNLVIKADVDIANEVVNDLVNDAADELLNEATDALVSNDADNLVNKAADDLVNEDADVHVNDPVNYGVNDANCVNLLKLPIKRQSLPAPSAVDNPWPPELTIEEQIHPIKLSMQCGLTVLPLLVGKHQMLPRMVMLGKRKWCQSKTPPVQIAVENPTFVEAASVSDKTKADGDIPIPIIAVSNSSTAAVRTAQIPFQFDDKTEAKTINDKLRQAVLDGDHSLVKLFLEQLHSSSIIVNSSTTIQDNALHQTIDYAINSRDATGMTLLMTAAETGSDPIVLLLARHGADVNAWRNDGSTALMLAAEKGFLTTVRLLLSPEMCAHVNQFNLRGDSALVKATKCRRYDVMKYLLQCGANARMSIKYDPSAMSVAKKQRNVASLIMLDEHERFLSGRLQHRVSRALCNSGQLIRPLFPVQCICVRDGSYFRTSFFFDQRRHPQSSVTETVNLLLVAHTAQPLILDNGFHLNLKVKQSFVQEVLINGSCAEVADSFEACPPFAFRLGSLGQGINDITICTRCDQRSSVKLIFRAYCVEALCYKERN